MSETPENGWWPDEAPVTQMLFKNGKPVAQVIRQSGAGWRAFSLTELNKSGTTGKPLGDSVPTQSEAKIIAEKYIETPPVASSEEESHS